MINNVVILGLDKRKDLWLDLEKQCLDKGWTTDIYIVGDGSDTSLKYNRIDKEPLPDKWIWRGTGDPQKAYWAFLSHQEIIKRAQEQKIEHLLLLEDDTYLTDRFNSVWSSVEPKLSKIDWDIIYLGWHAFEYNNHLFSGKNLYIEETYNKNRGHGLLQIEQCGGLFGVLINKSLYSKILEFKPIKPVDSQLNDIRKTINSYNVVPIIIWLKSCFSECEQQIIKRDIL